MSNLSNPAKYYIGGAFALIALFLFLAHSGGASQVLSAGFGGLNQDFKTLQGR